MFYDSLFAVGSPGYSKNIKKNKTYSNKKYVCFLSCTSPKIENRQSHTHHINFFKLWGG